MIYPDQSNANRIWVVPAELVGLIPHVGTHAVNLLDHRLRENLGFGSYFNRRNVAKRDSESWTQLRWYCGYALTKRTISPARRSARGSVFFVQDQAMRGNAGD